jgi:hypothetical protein
MDLSIIQGRLDKLQNKSKGNGAYNKEERAKSFWKPAIGKSQIRVVPSQLDKSNPFKEMYFHYIANRTMLSLTNWGEKDPIVEFASQLRKTGEKENWSIAKQIEPKMRVFLPIIVRGEEAKGVRWFEFGKAIYQDLLSMAADEDIGDFTDIYEGRDFLVETVGPDVTGTKYNKTTLRPRTKQTSLSEDATQAKQWLSEQPDLMSFYKKHEYDEMKGILMNHLNPEQEATGDEEDEVVTTPAPAPKTVYAEPAATKKKSSFDEDEFDALFSESKPTSKVEDDLDDDDDLPF